MYLLPHSISCTSSGSLNNNSVAQAICIYGFQCPWLYPASSSRQHGEGWHKENTEFHSIMLYDHVWNIMHYLWSHSVCQKSIPCSQSNYKGGLEVVFLVSGKKKQYGKYWASFCHSHLHVWSPLCLFSFTPKRVTPSQRWQSQILSRLWALQLSPFHNTWK